MSALEAAASEAAALRAAGWTWSCGGRNKIVSDRAVFGGIGAASAVVFGFLVWLIYLRDSAGAATGTFAALPALNAAFNAAAATCLVAGFLAIRKGRRSLHASLMITAFALSALFLVSYVVYHSVQGDTRFMGTGAIRSVYFFVLISHIVVTAAALPMILTTLFYAGAGRFSDHRRLARRTLPAWLYVSVTGVAVFFLLRVYG